MISPLWDANTPAAFWRLMKPEPSAVEWAAAAEAAAAVLPRRVRTDGDELSQLLVNTLGEGQFGPHHWELSRARRTYNAFKPLLPRSVRRRMRQLHRALSARTFPLDWPIESRYASFQWALMRDLLNKRHTNGTFIHFWPQGFRFALVLTHDIETARGQANVRAVAELEEGYGFRSSFNFVPEDYRVDRNLVEDLRTRGFEVGIHGLKHDGKLFSSHEAFMRQALRINRYLKELGAVGFRAPLMHRQPEWMQALTIEYDLSFFDTDPYEPIPGGTMCIWPFEIGHFVELPYTLVQDHTLTVILGEKTPRVWLDKVDFVASYCGLALVNTHPDYLASRTGWRVYEDFLSAMRRRPNDYWHDLPREVARWWRARRKASSVASLPDAVSGEIWYEDSSTSPGGIRIVTTPKS